MPTRLPEPAGHSTRVELASCRGLLKQGSRSFHAASLLLPQPYRDGAVSLYAFCRQADDAIDNGGDPARALTEFRARVDAMYRDMPEPHAADRALHAVIRRCGIPRALLDALLEGFSWDCLGHRYADFSSLLAYAARVAGSVGVMMALIMGRRDPATLARAADLGVAMQLTNIARDVGEDARAGRVYLPLAWLEAAQVDPAELVSAPTHDVALGSVVRRLLAEADWLYRRSEAGIARLPGICRPCVLSARLLYAEIGQELGRRQFDAVSRRAVVGTARKCRVLTRLGTVGRLDQRALDAVPLAEAGFLLDAVRYGPEPRPTAPGNSQQWRLDLERVVGLFAALEDREVRRAGIRPRRLAASRPTRNPSRLQPRDAAS